VGRHFHFSGSITVTKSTQTVESAGGTFRTGHAFPPNNARRMLPETTPRYRCLA
jgi:hypothetical protein